MELKTGYKMDAGIEENWEREGDEEEDFPCLWVLKSSPLGESQQHK